MAKRKGSTLWVVILVAVVLGSVGSLIGVFVVSGTSAGPGAHKDSPGVVYDTPVPVADFTLTDQTNTSFTFSSTQGKVVLMAFLFTHCADVCPFSAIKMRLALEQLGDRAREVELVVVSTDPERDTVPVIADYSQELGLYDRWHYLTGDPKDLQAVYKSLKITVIKADQADQATSQAKELGSTLSSRDQTDSPVAGLTDAQIVAGSTVAKKYSGGYDVAHSAPFWVVDKAGKVRTSLDVSATPAELVEALRTYLD